MILANHRDHAGEGPAKQVEDQRDDQRAAQARIGAHGSESLRDAGQHGGGTACHAARGWRQQHGRHQRRQIKQRRQYESAIKPQQREQHTTKCWPQHAAGIACADINGHGRTHARGPHHGANHGASHRIIGRPTNAIDEGRHRQMPNRDHVQQRKQRDHGGCQNLHHQDQDLHAAQIHSLGCRTQKGAKQPHGQKPQHGQHRNNKGRPGGVIGENTHRQHFQPAHHENGKPHHPEPTKVALLKQASPMGFGQRHGALRIMQGRPGKT